jgi:outer membrane autotransporter protein
LHVAAARTRGVVQRRALLAGSMLAGTILFTALTAPAQADGGAGGNSGGAGGTGGTTSATSAGGNGGTATGTSGGGGGGAGTTGGNGSNGGGVGGAGGAGGAIFGANGAPGAGGQNGGGGGGGGAHGALITSTSTNSAALSGGTGGAGGVSIPFAGGGGGGGGAGGYGAVVNASVTYTNTSTISGGNGGGAGSGLLGGATGGNGGAGGIGVLFTTAGASFTNSGTVTGGNGGVGGGGALGAVAGNGGAGGIGVLFTSTGATFTNSGTVTGGNGGAGGISSLSALNGTPGAGGVGVAGLGLTIINSGTISGGLSGDGVTRANAITFTGGANTLELRPGSTVTGNVVAFSTADTLALGGTGSASFDVSQIGSSAQYQGFGVFQKTGTSTWTLTGTNTAALPWTINAGTLVVNGTMANSTMTVNNGGTLAGTGTVGATTINSGGTFAPGNSPGTMTVQGNLAFQSGAIYLVQINPSIASSSNVSGSATLAGTVQAAFAAGSYATRIYTILTAAGGLGGTTFNALTTTNLPAGFTASLSYTATDAILNLTATLGQPTGPGGPSALACAFSINQCNVANALNAFFNNGGALPPNFVTIFGLTGANLANALTLLSGEAATEAQQVGFQLTNQFLGIMLDPFVDGRSGIGGGSAIGFAPEREELPDDIALAYAKIIKAPPKPVAFEQRWSVWGAGYGGSNRTSGDVAVVGSHDLSARTAGGAAGLDYRLAPGTVVGFALAGGGTNWSLAQGIGGGKSDAFQAGIYGTTRWGAAYVAAALAFTNHWMSTDRFAFAGDHLTSSFNAQSFGGRVEGGYRFATIYGGLTPYAAVQAQTFHTPSYNESDLNAGGFGLAFNSRNATDTRSELGGRFDRLLLLNPEAALTLRARLAWAHDWLSDPSLVPLFQALPGASFVVNGATPAKNSALTSAGFEYRLASGVVLLAKFDGEFASHSSTYAGTGTVRYTW